MEPSESEALVAELENRLDRLRALYEQYFLGFEKLEPLIPKKDVERRFDTLRRTQLRNTRLKFRFTMLQQRYNTFQSYWSRICRQIEDGTYKRRMLKSKVQLSAGIAKDAESSWDIDVDLDDYPGEGALSDDAADEFDSRATEPPPSAIFKESASSPYRALATAPGPFSSSQQPTSGMSLGALRSLGALGSDGASPSLLSALAPQALPTGVAMSSQPKALLVSTMPAVAKRPELRMRSGAPDSARAVSLKASAPVAPPPVVSAAPGGPVVTTSGIAIALVKPSTPRPAPPRPSAVVAAAPVAPTAPIAHKVVKDELADERIQELYAGYVKAKRERNESTAKITYETVASSLRDSSKRLREKYQGKAVDFEVSEKDGKTILKPVVR